MDNREFILKIQEIIITSMVTALLSILFATILDEMYYSIVGFYDIALIFSGIVSALFGLIVTTKSFFRFNFGKNAKDGVVLAIISWIIYLSYFFIQYNVIYSIELVVLIGLFIGCFLYSILLRPDRHNETLKTITTTKREFPFLNTGLGIVPILVFGAIFGFAVAQFSWIIFGQIQIALSMEYPDALFYAPPLIYQIGWTIVGTLGFPLHYSSKGKII